MDKNQALVPWFRRGDIGGITYLVTNNIVNYLIVIATLSGVLKWPDKIVFGAVIPGMSIGLMLGCFYYAFMARRLSQKEGRADVTALPSGVSTPAMFVFLYGVIMPLHYALGDPEMAWSAGVAACFIGGFVEFCGGIIGPWLFSVQLPASDLSGWQPKAFLIFWEILSLAFRYFLWRHWACLGAICSRSRFRLL